VAELHRDLFGGSGVGIPLVSTIERRQLDVPYPEVLLFPEANLLVFLHPDKLQHQ